MPCKPLHTCTFYLFPLFIFLSLALLVLPTQSFINIISPAPNSVFPSASNILITFTVNFDGLTSGYGDVSMTITVSGTPTSKNNFATQVITFTNSIQPFQQYCIEYYLVPTLFTFDGPCLITFNLTPDNKGQPETASVIFYVDNNYGPELTDVSQCPGKLPSSGVGRGELFRWVYVAGAAAALMRMW